MATWIRRSRAWTSMGRSGPAFGPRPISSSSGQWILAQPQPSLLMPAGRDWSYEIEVSAKDYEEIVGDADSNIVALGVSTEKGGSVAVSAVSTETLDIDGSR